MQGWGGGRPGPGGEQAPSLSSSALCGVGDAATTAPPPYLPFLVGGGAPTLHGSCPVENEPTCDAGPGAGTLRQGKACVSPRLPQGILAAGPPSPRAVLMAEDVPGSPGERKLPVRTEFDCLSTPSAGAGARRGAPGVWGGPVPSRAPPPAPPLIAVLGPGPAALPVPVMVALARALRRAGTAAVVPVGLVQIGVGVSVLLLLLQVPRAALGCGSPRLGRGVPRLIRWHQAVVLQRRVLAPLPQQLLALRAGRGCGGGAGGGCVCSSPGPGPLCWVPVGSREGAVRPSHPVCGPLCQLSIGSRKGAGELRVPRTPLC